MAALRRPSDAARSIRAGAVRPVRNPVTEPGAVTPVLQPELINSGVSIEVVRRRLGHASTETTQAYALLADKVADTEIRAARRRRGRAAAR